MNRTGEYLERIEQAVGGMDDRQRYEVGKILIDCYHEGAIDGIERLRNIRREMNAELTQQRREKLREHK